MGKAIKLKNPVVIGLIERITINGPGKSETLLAKVDTGATKSSIDLKLAKELDLGPVIRSKMVKSAHGNKLRPIVEINIVIAKKNIRTEFTLADRRHLKYMVLIGQNILKNGFIIDPLKKNSNIK